MHFNRTNQFLKTLIERSRSKTFEVISEGRMRECQWDGWPSKGIIMLIQSRYATKSERQKGIFKTLRCVIYCVLKSGLQLPATGWSLISDVDQICAEREDLITHRRGWQWPWGRCVRRVERREWVLFQVFPLPVPPVLAVVVHVVVVVVVVVMMASVELATA